MITSVTSINKISSTSSDQYSSQACLNLARTYEILNFFDRKETGEPIETINPAEELSDKHWDECRQIGLYDDELRQAVGGLSKAIDLLISNGIVNDQAKELGKLCDELKKKLNNEYEDKQCETKS